MKKITTLFIILCQLSTQAQKLEPTQSTALYSLFLKCIEGGVFPNQEVVFTNMSDKSTIKSLSDAGGCVRVLLPINSVYEFKIKNYSETRTVTIPDAPYATMNNTLQYSKNDVAFVEKYKMNAEQLKALDAIVKALPDTCYFNTTKPNTLKSDQNFASLTFRLKDINNGPLTGETVLLTSRTSKKNFKGPTDATGAITFFIPKGDTYDLSFRHDKNYDVQEINSTLGTMRSTVQINYMGTKEIERRMAEKEKQLKEEAIRLEKEKKEFAAYMKRERLSALDARKKEMKEYESGTRHFKDDVILKVFERNKHWKDKLVVCDLTGSMSPYAAQLEIWYKLNYMKEQNLQFVFFNDGDDNLSVEQKAGRKGGIYYSPSKGIDELANLMAMVQTAGSGGDCPENNMEALIRGTEQASAYKEIVMIADNHAPIKDLALLTGFNIPVRIILCGVDDEIEPDYLFLAWKTKGTVHTMEEDILSIGKLMDGQEIKINGKAYRLMKNKFVPIYKA
jgi:hypothetical protein